MSADVTIPSSVVASASLPTTGICVLHALPTTGTRSVTFRSKTPGWVWLLIPFGLLVALLVSEAVAKKVTGPVPECETCVVERRRRRMRVVCLWVVTGVLLVGVIATADAAPTASGVLALVMLVTLLWALAQLIVNGRRGVKGVVSKDAMQVELACAPAFAEACRARMASATSTM